jgi:hypothetical protein
MNGDQIRQRSAVLRDRVSEWRRGTCGHVGGYRDKLVFGLRRRNARSFRRHKRDVDGLERRRSGSNSRVRDRDRVRANDWSNIAEGRARS